MNEPTRYPTFDASGHLELKPSNSRRFYSFRMLETTCLKGQPVKNEITKTIHTTWQYLAHNSFLLHLEVFDREHKNRTLSLSEKDFHDYAARICDDVKLNLSSNAGLIDIFGFEQLDQRARDTAAHLSKSFAGAQAEQSLKLLTGIYSNKALT